MIVCLSTSTLVIHRSPVALSRADWRTVTVSASPGTAGPDLRRADVRYPGHRDRQRADPSRVAAHHRHRHLRGDVQGTVHIPPLAQGPRHVGGWRLPAGKRVLLAPARRE